jgi:hypothetical protein
MKRPLFYFLAFFSFLSGFSQERTFTIHGKVLDEKTGNPLAGASVFCQNTTMGTVSTNEGDFNLRLNNGGYDLVISYTGYETQLLRVNNGMKEKDSLKVILKEQDKSMTEVVVAGSLEVADGWAKYGQFFLDNFIGLTKNAEQCTLQNKEALKFYFYKKRNKLKVKAKEDLVILNDALGYKIHYQLDSFVNDYNLNISSYTGYPLFEEMTGTPEQQEIWKKNRFRSYIGSRLHFMRCWYDSTLSEEGYSIEKLDAQHDNQASPLDNPYDAAIYSVDSGTVGIDLKGSIRVTYKNQVPDRNYLVRNKFPLSAKMQISALDIVDGFSIEENGYFYEQSEITNIGYWAWKKLADLLPYDYNPE